MSAPLCIYYRLYDLKKSVQLIVTYPLRYDDNANPLLYLGIGALALITGVGVGLRGRKKKNKQ